MLKVIILSLEFQSFSCIRIYNLNSMYIKTLTF